MNTNMQPMRKGGRLRCSFIAVVCASLYACAAAPDPVDGLAPDAAPAPMRPTLPPSGTPPPATRPAVVIEAPSTRPQCEPGQYFIGRVNGTLLNFDGTPMRGGAVSVCGSVCFSGMSGADGRFEVVTNTCFSGNSEYAHGAAFGFDGLNVRPDVFFDFNASNLPHMGVVRLERPIYVGNFAAGARAVAPHTSTTPLLITDGLGFSLRIVPSTIEYPITADEEVVRVVRVPVAKLPAFEGRAPAVAYAIGPSDAELSAPAAVEFPNVSGLRAGTEVEIVGVGNHASAGNPAVGILARIDMGRVSADGRRVVANRGLRFFGTVGYRTVNP